MTRTDGTRGTHKSQAIRRVGEGEEEPGAPPHRWRDVTGIAVPASWQLLQRLHTQFPRDPATPRQVHAERQGDERPHKNSYMNVHGSVMRSHPEVETAPTAINGRMEK